MNNWQSKKLGEIVNIKNGTWGTADTQGTAVLRSTNFTNEGDLSYDNVAYREIQKNKISELSRLINIIRGEKYDYIINYLYVRIRCHAVRL